MKTLRSIVLFAAMAIGIAGCKKDSVDPPVDTPTQEAGVDATIRMHFSMLNGTVAFQLNTTILQDSLGHAVKLDDVRFFVSGIHALSDDGTAIGHYEGVYLLVNAAQDSTYDIGTIHASHIHEFHFDLGVDETANGGDIATATPPLNDATMYWDPAAGHKFLVVSGHADIDGDGTFETMVNYACGTDNLLTEAHAHVHHDLTVGEVFTAQLGVDLGQLFNGINLATDPVTDMDAPLCLRMMSNLSDAIDGD